MWILLLFLILSCYAGPGLISYSEALKMALEKEKENLLDEALVFCRKSIELQPNQPQCYICAARIWLKKGSTWRAKIYLEKAKSLGAKSEIDPLFAVIAIKEKDYIKADSLYNTIQKGYPYWEEVTFELGKHFLERNELEEAKEKFEHLVENEPNNWKGHWGIGTVYLKEKEYGKAKEELFIAYKQNPSYTTTISLANMFFELSEYEESYIMYIKSQSSLSDEALPDSISLKLELIKNKLISSTTNTNSNINFTLTTPSNINLSIFDINGQFVKTLYTGFLTKGKYELAWDGPSGIYIASLETENTLDAFTIKVQK